MNYSELMKMAEKARENSYSPYSHFAVGAALLTRSGRVYTGVNVENASYGGTICAERTAFVKAVSEGEREFAAIAISGGSELCPPCGICRQFMAEFAEDDFKIILGKNGEKILTLAELLPFRFGSEDLAESRK